jgi:hypothetical protein
MSIYLPPQILPWLRTHLQPVKARSIALMVAFPEQMCQIASTMVASGGLSHFVTDEQLDRQLLTALRAGSEEQLRAIPPKLLNAGSSEIRNWIAVAAASKHLKLVWDEYIPSTAPRQGPGVDWALQAGHDNDLKLKTC